MGMKGLKLLSGHPSLDSMDMCVSFEAEEGPLSLQRRRGCPSTLSLHQSQKATLQALPLEVKTDDFYFLVSCFILLLVFNVFSFATVHCSSRGVVYDSGKLVLGDLKHCLRFTNTTF